MSNFVVTAWFKPGKPGQWDAQHPRSFVEHLEQQVPRIKLEGPLFNRAGERVGIFMVLEAREFAQVDSLIASSPYTLGSLYERVDVSRVEIQSGRLD